MKKISKQNYFYYLETKRKFNYNDRLIEHKSKKARQIKLKN